MQKVSFSILFTVAIAAVLITVGRTSGQAAQPWKGIDWVEWQGATLFVNEMDNEEYLEVRPYLSSSENYCAAYHSTPDDFRANTAPWLEATFIDDPGKKSRVELWMTDRLSAWTQIGAWDTFDTYIIFWWNMSSQERGAVDTGIPRTPGRHTIKLGMHGNGKLDYWFDGTLVWSTDKIKPRYFGDVYLATLYSRATFVDYQSGTNYAPAVSAIDIDLDIKPGGNPNNINLTSRGVVPVALLTTADFDATSVDPLSLLFAEAVPVRWKMVDVDEDGDVDLLCHFETQELNLGVESAEAVLTGSTYDGTEIRGADSVRIISKSQEAKKKGK
jgi:hypothetical protein